MEKYLKSLDTNAEEEQKKNEKEKKKIITNAYVVIINEMNFPKCPMVIY